MGDEFRLGCRDRRELPTQGIGDLPVQDLPPALEQGFVSGVLNQRVLEGIARIGRRTRAEQQLRLFELRQRRAQRRLVAADDGAQQRVGECVFRDILAALFGRLRAVKGQSPHDGCGLITSIRKPAVRAIATASRGGLLLTPREARSDHDRQTSGCCDPPGQESGDFSHHSRL